MKFSKSLSSLPLLLAFTAISLSATPALLLRATAQDSPSPTFTLPTSVPSGTEIKIIGSSSMEQFSKALADKFQGKFAGTKIDLSTADSAAALQSLLDGKADLAAIGRPLTAEEKAKGLTAITVARNKIAMIVGKDNPFSGGLDISKFAKIFRGEITDWADVGGTAGPIVFVDRPGTSDTRQSFSGYPVFASGLTAGSSAKPVTDDTTDAVAAALGNNGIGYAIADQAVNNPNVKVIAMHMVPPSDPRYPFSQPLSYVYSGTPKPGVEAFLGYLTAPENQNIVEEARVAAVTDTGTPVATATSPTTSPTAVESPVDSPEASPTTALVPETSGNTEGGGMPWWPWLLGGAALAGLGLWALKGRGSQPTATPPAPPVTTPAAPPPAPKPAIPTVAAAAAAAGATVAAGVVAAQAAKPLARRLILTPRSSNDAYAYWEVDDQIKADLRRQGGEQLKLLLKDVTALDLSSQTPPVIGEFNCSETDPDLHVPITSPGRDYQAELGYRTADGKWLPITESAPVTVPKTTPTPPPAPSGSSQTVAQPAKLDLTTPSQTGSGQTVTEPAKLDLGLGAAIASGAPAVTGAVTGAFGSATSAVDSVADSVDDSATTDDDTSLFGDLMDSLSGGASKVTDVAGSAVSGVTNLVGDGVGGLGAALAGGATATAGAIGLGAAAGQTPPPESPTLSSEDDSGLFGNIAARATEAAQNLTGSLGDVVGKTTDLIGGAAGQVGNLTGGGLQNVGTVLAGGAAAAIGAAGLGAATQPLGAGAHPPMPKDCRIVLVPRNSQDAYAYWEIYDSYRAPVRQQGGQRLMLRVHDVTNIDVDRAAPLGTQEFPIDEEQCDLHVKIPVPDRDYIAEVGYYTADNVWLRIIRSFHVHVPAA